MGVRRFEDLEAWQAATDLKREVYALTDQGTAIRDFKFRDQIRDSAASAPRNIAEGFGRFRPASFAHFVEIAIGSLMETQCLLRDGFDRHHFSASQVAGANVFAERALRISTKLAIYLKGRAREKR